MSARKIALGCATLLVSGAAGIGHAQTALRSLRGIPVPEPAGLSEFVRNRSSLVALGKIFFWDMQAGSDGMTACATCHFHAGADHRPQNQLSDPDNAFPLNLNLAAAAFPFRLLSNPLNKNSAALRDTSMRAGSAGTYRRIFEGIVPGQAAELGRDAGDKPEFMLGGLQVRRVTTRNTPSVLNTAFYARQFWDGRADAFNGFTVTGLSEDAPGLLVWRDGALVREQIRLSRASLAAQAVGPVLDHLEMSYAGRPWRLLARKLLSLRPLGQQRVDANDSVLGELARGGDERGLRDEFTYRALIEAAFEPRWWESPQLVDPAGEVLSGRTGSPENNEEATQLEYNFPLFWALALQAYQSTLNSDDSPFDRFMEGDRSALTAQQQEGMRLFQTTGNCTECHNGPEFSAAAFNLNGTTRGNHAFDRTGVRPAAEDQGAGNAAFKSMGLRNIEFTGPYFHNGGQATLEQVIDFYRRGGDFAPVANDLRPLNINDAQRDALVAFLKSLSDDRVRHDRAPFDHPELCVPAGHPEAEPGVLTRLESAQFTASATETYRAIPATGAGGHQVPLRTFDEMLRGIGRDGERAHALTEACAAN